MKLTPLALITAALFAAPVFAQEGGKPSPAAPAVPAKAEPETKKEEKKVLSVGDPAPAYTVEAWIKGEPVKSFEKGKVYVVEFWATWCGPCIRAFPHLSEQQAKYKDKVTFIGTNVWEQYDEKTLDKVKAFVEKQGDKMAYTVAYDGKSATTNDAWMKAAGQNGIPCAFIVDGNGKIVYIGHPMEMDKTLEEVVAGKFDPAAAKAKADAAKAAEKKLAKIRSKIQKAAEAEDWDGVAKGMDEMAAADPDNKGRYLSSKFNIYFKQKNDYKAAYAMKDALLAEKSVTDNAQTCNQIAWGVVDPAAGLDKKDRDLDFALAFANKANDAAGGKDGAILDTLARVYFEKGDKAKAIELQEKAVKAVEKDDKIDDQMKDEIKATLEEYKKSAAKDKV